MCNCTYTVLYIHHPSSKDLSWTSCPSLACGFLGLIGLVIAGDRVKRLSHANHVHGTHLVCCQVLSRPALNWAWRQPIMQLHKWQKHQLETSQMWKPCVVKCLKMVPPMQHHLNGLNKKKQWVELMEVLNTGSQCCWYALVENDHSNSRPSFSCVFCLMTHVTHNFR